MENIKENSIIVVPNYLKEQVLLKISEELKNIKVMTISSFIDNFLFSFDEKAIYYLMKEYSLKYDVALMYLNNLKFIENKNYSFNKLNDLVRLKINLEKLELLIYNSQFKETMKRKNIVFYEIQETKFNKWLIKQVKEITEVSIINKVYDKEYKHEILEFNDFNDEVEFVAEKVSELLNEGVDVSSITLLNIGTDYLFSLKRVFNIFNIPINLKEKNTILSTKMVTFFLNNINSDINVTLSLIKEKFDLKNHKNFNLYNQIIMICNKYSWINDYNLIRDLLVHDFSVTHIETEKIINSVNVVNLEEYIPNDNDYVFLLGFNQRIVPILEKDEDYISDKMKLEVYTDTTAEKNEIHNNICLKVIKNTKNMWISYIKNNDSDLSTINNVLNYQVIKWNKKHQYSYLNNLINLSKELDTYLTYGVKTKELTDLYSNYSDIKYRSFNNQFKGIKGHKKPLVLSYSSIDNYYKCSFRYYISSVLKLNIYEENFANYLGSLFHFCLSKRKEYSLEESWNLFLEENKKELTNKEKFFLEKGKRELEYIFEVLDVQSGYTSFNDEEYETRIEIEKGKDTKFVGIIDKIMFNKEQNLSAIVDYKTGNPELKLNNIPHGLNLQLPIYLYLLKNKYPNMEVVGFYLQKILPSIIVKDASKTLDSQRKELLKLQGYSLKNEEKISYFDKTYVDSNLIKSMKVGNNGFYAYSKTLNNSEMDNIINVVDNKIDEAIKNIDEGNFKINPKHIGKENIGCTFCKFKDICFVNNKDVVYLEEIKDLSFLGGDNNA